MRNLPKNGEIGVDKSIIIWYIIIVPSKQPKKGRKNTMFNDFDTTICSEEFYDAYLNWKAMKDFYKEEEEKEGK